MRKSIWKLTLASLAALVFLPAVQAQEAEKITFRCDNKTWVAILIYCDFFRF